MPPRRNSTYLLLVGFFFFILLIFYPPSQFLKEPIDENIVQKPVLFKGNLPTFDVPSFHISFRKSSHKPQEQRNSTLGDISWYSDWSWLSPFSSSITLAENRTVLAPLPPRPPVYTYYDPHSDKAEESIKVDQQLLLTWRRAWWAHGFRPVVLGPADAQKHPFFERVQGLLLPQSLGRELNRWLAWGHVGSGMLASWHCVPMGSDDDALLSYLRRGQYPALTKFDGLGTGLFAAENGHINDAIQEILSSPKLMSTTTVLEILNPERFKIEQVGAIAHYDSLTVKYKYPAIAQKMETMPSEGCLALNTLINSHLHSTWQNIFNAGIAVVKPLPHHTTALVAPSVQLANLLAQCPPSMMPSTCPPNRQKCTPCVSSRVRIRTHSSFRDIPSLYSIGTVPHPYTLISLNNQSDAITVKHIRRYTDRDPWLTAVTRDILGSGRGGPSRLVRFKEIVASEHGRSRTLWLAADQTSPFSSGPNKGLPQEEWLADLDWHFGFSIPRAPISHGESIPPVPGPERWPKSEPGLPEERKKSYDPDLPNEIELAIEMELLEKADRLIKTKNVREGQMRNVAEAWNLADTEAWRFARAYRARSLVERLKWEEEERGHIVEGKGRGRWWRT